MRKQYFFRPSPGGFCAWDVDRLIALTAEYPRRQVALSEIRELDEPWFGPGESATWIALVEHVKLIEAADLAYPIILAADGTVMDGMHRAAKALQHGLSHIQAVQFAADPPPDYHDVQPTELPYDETPARGATMRKAHLVALTTFPTEAEALLAKGVLEAAGIECMVRADNAGGMYPAIGGVELLVRAEDRDRARDALGAES
jgi:hypothetical protein